MSIISTNSKTNNRRKNKFGISGIHHTEMPRKIFYEDCTKTLGCITEIACVEKRIKKFEYIAV